jgi:outer membrane protein OmpA-like peptidoglycan-associated protein
MSPLGHVALAAIAAALTGCATAETFEYTAVDAAVLVADLPAYEGPVPLSDFDIMQTELPGFDLRRSVDPMTQYSVSVVRDLTFAPKSSILPRENVTRLAPLQTYLRANPSVAVRITGYGDGPNSGESERDLSLSRAHSVARVLVTDIKVANSVNAVSASMPQEAGYVGRAEIAFTRPVARPRE